MPAPIFFDDIQPNSRIVGPSVVIDEEEMVDFARKWDPVPIHVDKEAGKAAFGSLTAPGVYLFGNQATPTPRIGTTSCRHCITRIR